MANYTSNEKSTGLNIVSTVDQTDLLLIGDVSDSGKLKAITEEDFENNLAVSSNFISALVGNSTFTTDLANDSNFITNLTNNSTFQNLVNAFVTGGGGNGAGIQKLSQTFSHTDFANVGGQGVAGFTDSLPVDAVPIGVVYDITTAFDSGLTLGVYENNTTSPKIGGNVAADVIQTLTAETDGNNTKFDFNTNPNPNVYNLTGVPTVGQVTVSILYVTTNVAESINTYTAKPVAQYLNPGTIPLSDNTKMYVGMVNIPNEITFTKLSTYINAHTTAGTFGYVIYSEDGQTKILSGTSGTISSAGVVNTITTTSTTLTAGNYYFGVHGNSTANFGLRSVTVDTTPLDPSGKAVMNGIVTITASTTPATINPVSDITYNDNGLALIRLDA